MADDYYTKLWHGAVQDVSSILESDKILQRTSLETHDAALVPLADLYVRYVQLVKKLDVLYDQIVQPQKRPLIRKLLDMSIGRMLELRDMLTQAEVSPYAYYDQVLMEHQLTPFEMETAPPRYFRTGNGRETLLQDRRERIERVLRERGGGMKAKEGITWRDGENDEKGKEIKVEGDKEEGDEAPKEAGGGDEAPKEGGGGEEGDEGGKQPEAGKLSLTGSATSKKSAAGGASTGLTLAEEARAKAAEKARVERAEREGVDPVTGELTFRGAVKLLQRHERARQSRMRYAQKKGKYLEDQRKLRGERSAKADEEVLHAAATLIQKTWRGYLARKRLKHSETRRLLLLGMVPPSAFHTELQDAATRVERRRHQLQIESQVKLEERMAEEFARFMNVKAPWLREDLTDEVRKWFVEWYVKAAEFPVYPTEEQGGALCIVGKTLTSPEKFLQKKEKLRREKQLIKQGKKQQTDAQKDKKKMKELKKKEKAEKKAKAKQIRERMKRGERLEPLEFEASNCYPELMEAQGEYNTFWLGRDERERPDQPLELDLLRKEVVAECTRDVRLQVDEFMKLELVVLNDALARDRGKKKKKKKGKKGKKKKKGKKGKKAPVELTEVELWQMFDDLVAQGFIKNYPEVFIKDFMGDFSYVTQELRKRLAVPDPPPGLGEIRQVVTETCVLALGSGEVHRCAPLVRSACIAGLAGGGKHFLAHAVCTETGAVMFDMSPQVVANSEFAKGKGGLKEFVKVAGGVAKYLQPAVFFVDGAEKPFYKKIPKEEKELKPRGVAKFLKKIAKMITPEEQILILGVTSQPWAGKKGMVKMFERWIMMPVPDYSTVMMTWQMELLKYYGVDRQFLVTPITIQSRDYSMQKILSTIHDHMNLQRRIKLSQEPLTAEELLKAMLEQTQYTPKELAKLRKWSDKNVPLEKYRAKVLSNERIAAGLEEPKKKKEKKK